MRVSVHHRIFCCLTIAAALCAYVDASPVKTAPSDRLKAALDIGMPGQDAKGEKLDRLIRDVLYYTQQASGASVNVSIEYDSSAKGPLVTAKIPVGSLRSQLDAISDSASYSWTADGDWVEFIPRSKANDPQYILNKRIPGRVVVTRDPLRATSIKEWLAANNVSTTRDIHRLRFIADPSKPVREDTNWKPVSFSVELQDPTLREYAVATEALYGHDICTMIVKEARGKDGKVQSVSLTSWGQCTKPIPKDKQPAKQ